ncbi:ABC transporter ATP-binding protein [Sphingomonas fennica]|uniref:ATP-binding protein n=1 Tax=Edaphosphingomonas fennica TaxID=114404 RepID=A0A2T4HLR6_9SPHN|nr:ABC transporter ATP-binding protein [Sphingomonas fennica]PTD16752.1 ATP-binding protein [Sphingomonas fennica]
MIDIQNVTKVYETRQGARTVLRNASLRIERHEKVGILGRNGAGKSTMVRLISGAEQPSAGRIERKMSVSWPLAFGGAFQNALTGLDNLRFICRIYGVDAEDKIAAVEDFSELGIYLREPLRTYSAGMRARLAFAISMAIEFDCFLIDEVVAVGDSRFRERCHTELFEKRGDRAMIIVSHNREYVKRHCDKAAVLIDGVMTAFDDVDEAYEFYGRSVA